MAKGKCKNKSNRNQDYLASSEPSSPTTANPGYPSTPEKQDSDLKSHLMMMIEEFKDTNHSLKEIQENTGKQVEDLKRKHKNPLKNYRKTQPNR
jgi:FtsZ-binding cell division protein ZapB